MVHQEFIASGVFTRTDGQPSKKACKQFNCTLKKILNGETRAPMNVSRVHR